MATEQETENASGGSGQRSELDRWVDKHACQLSAISFQSLIHSACLHKSDMLDVATGTSPFHMCKQQQEMAMPSVLLLAKISYVTKQ